MIGSSPDISLEDPSARKKILHLIRKYQETKNSNLVIVFDGGPDSVLEPEPAGSKVSVVFPGFGSTADDEIKKIYRQKCNDFHPDKLASKGLPDEFMEYAHEQLAKVNEAYDTIKKARV